MAKGKDFADSVLLLENFIGVWRTAGGRRLENKNTVECCLCSLYQVRGYPHDRDHVRLGPGAVKVWI